MSDTTRSPAPVGRGGSAIEVLHVVKGLDVGGTENLLLLAARHRDRDRVAMRVARLLPDADTLVPALEDEGVPTTCLDGVPWWDPRWLVRLRRLLRDHPTDVVHGHSPLVASGARVVARSLPRGRRPRVVTTLHNTWDSHHVAVRALDRLTWRLDDHRLAVSDAARLSLPGDAADRATTLVHGIDVDDLRSRADHDAARAELGAGPDDLVVGTVANPGPLKGYPDLLEAAVEVSRTDSRARFVAIGEGPTRSELEARRDRLGLGEAFRFLGFRPDAAALIAGFDVFCLASHHEGLPLSLMEALVLGVPVVVTDVGGIPEVVTDDREGVLVHARRPERLARALIAELADDETRRRHARAAHETGTALDAARAVRSLEDLYRQVLTP